MEKRQATIPSNLRREAEVIIAKGNGSLPPTYDVFWERATEHRVRASLAGGIHVSSAVTGGVALRYESGTRREFLHTAVDDRATCQHFLNDAAQRLPAGLFERSVLERLDLSDPAPAGDDADFLGRAKEIVTAACESARSLGAQSVEVGFWRRTSTSAVSGPSAAAQHRQELVRLTVRAGEPGAMGFGAAVPASDMPLDAQWAAELAADAVAQSDLLKRSRPPQSAQTAVVLAPEAAGTLIHEMIGHSLETGSAPDSALWSRRGQRISHPALFVREEPTHTRAWDTAAVDDEGSPCLVADLIVDGMVAGILSDRRGAITLAAPLTGSARRAGYARPPMARMRHTVTAAGPDQTDAILADTSRGIYITAVDSADAQPGPGRFSIRARTGWAISGGECTEPLRDFTLTGDLATLADIDAIGDHTGTEASLCGRQGHWLPVSHTAPVLRLRKASIRGRRPDGE